MQSVWLSPCWCDEAERHVHAGAVCMAAAVHAHVERVPCSSRFLTSVDADSIKELVRNRYVCLYETGLENLDCERYM